MPSGLGCRKPKRFAYGPSVVIVVCAAVVWLASTTFILYRDYQAGLTAIQANFDQIARGYVPTIAGSLRKGEADEIDVGLQGILRIKDVVYVDIVEPFGVSGEVRKALGDTTAPRDFVRKYSLSVQDAASPNQTARVAILTVVANRVGIRQRVINTGVALTLLGGAVLALAMVVVNATFGRRLARQVNLSEARVDQYRRLAETVGVGITLMDRDHRVLMSNGVHGKLLSCHTEEVVPGQFCYEAFMSRESVCEDCPAEQAMAEKRPVEVVKCYPGEDGTGRWLRRQAFPISDDDGGIQGFIEVLEDVSQQQQVQGELAACEVRLQTALDASENVIFIKDREGIYTHASTAVDRFLGVSREQLLGCQDARFLDSGESKALAEVDARVLTGSTVREEHTRLVDGQSRTFLVTRTPLRDEAGTIVGLCGVARDVSDAKQLESELAGQQQRLLSTLESLPGYVFLLAADGSIRFANAAFRRLYGDPEGRFVDDVLRGRPTPLEACPASRVFESRRLEIWEWTDAHGRTYVVRDIPFEDVNGDLLVLELGFDVSDRIKAERSLKASEVRFDRLADNAQDMIYRVAWPQRQCEYVSPAASAITGHSPSEFTGDAYLLDAVIHERSRSAVEDHWEAVARGETPEPFSHRIVHRSGEEHWVNHRCVAVRDEEGNLYAIEGFLTDITAWKRSEELIRDRINNLTRPVSDASGASFEDLFDLEEVQRFQDAFAAATGVASIITDPHGEPLTQPSNFCRLCNDVIRKTDKGLANCMRSDAALGRPHADGPIVQPCLSGGLWDGGASITAGDQHIANWLIGQVRNECQSEEQMMAYAREIGADEDEFRQALGEVTTMSTEQFQQVCNALFLFANQLSRMAFQNMWQAREIHAREQAEAELKRYRDQLEDLVSRRTKELETAQGELLRKQQLATLGQIIASVSHELRNPLGTIRSTVYTLQERLSGKGLGVDRAVSRVERNVLRCDTIIEGLLDFTRLKRPDLTMEKLDAWVSSVVDELQCPSHVTVVRKLSTGSAVPFDSEVLRRALINVATNAFQAMPDQPGHEHQLIVETAIVGDRAEIRVSDTGEGISEADMEHVFEPLFSTRSFGIGLGLSIVRQIMQRHGGDVTVESEFGRGTSMILWWPCHSSGGASHEEEITHSDRR